MWWNRRFYCSGIEGKTSDFSFDGNFYYGGGFLRLSIKANEKKKMQSSLYSSVTEPVLFVCEVSVHFLKKAFHGNYRLFLYKDQVVFIDPDAPVSMQRLCFQRKAVSFASALVSPSDEESEVYDWLLYDAGDETAEIHTSGKIQDALKAALQESAYLGIQPSEMKK